jgi:hypothetical protein
VVTPGSFTKNPHSAVALNLSKDFKGASFTGRKNAGACNASLKKEGNIFIQVIYPDNIFNDGVYSIPLYIKAMQYKGGKVVPVWYCNNNLFTAAFKDILKSTMGVDIGSEWLNYAMKFMVETETRDTRFGADVQKLCQDK